MTEEKQYKSDKILARSAIRNPISTNILQKQLIACRKIQKKEFFTAKEKCREKNKPKMHQ